ncbi:hypothetical protein TrRE_jg6384 [Triparma retinervis]|uniref:WW domain-containing protein n=1 Tax=Triparma retinervis TaxID=2557542 RepID=A0A9W7G540_9STRA|nr:hypothetical protein TrRE_jg6384 [Triparma retinervis]
MDHQATDDPDDPFSTAGKASLNSLAFEDPSWGVQAMASPAAPFPANSFGNFQDTGLGGRALDGGNGGFGHTSGNGRGGMLPTFEPGKTNPFDFLEAGLKEDRKVAATPGKAVWYEGWDEGHKCYYYFNEMTKESRWTKPDEPVVGYGEGEEEEEDEDEDEAFYFLTSTTPYIGLHYICLGHLATGSKSDHTFVKHTTAEFEFIYPVSERPRFFL